MAELNKLPINTDPDDVNREKEYRKRTNKIQCSTSVGSIKQRRKSKEGASCREALNIGYSPLTTSDYQDGERITYTFKVLVIGDKFTGKTSFVNTYANNNYSQSFQLSLGVDHVFKVIKMDQYTTVRLQMWDFIGDERYRHMNHVFFRGADGALIVADVTRNETFYGALRWKHEVDTKVMLPHNKPIPCVLLANKCDLPKTGISANALQMDEFCRKYFFKSWFEVSAREQYNLDDAVRSLIYSMMDNVAYLKKRTDDTESLCLSKIGNKHRSKSCGCAC